MSRFMSQRFASLDEYVPGEQPLDMQYVKLNTNESPFPPSPLVYMRMGDEISKLKLYPDPNYSALRKSAAKLFKVKPENIICVNGSDEVLSFAFMAFCDSGKGVAFPSISYGFYDVFANLYGIKAKKIPLREDFSICADDYCDIGCNVVIANPNAPTGILLSVEEIEKIIKSNPDSVVVIDEAYVDFGGKSCIPLVEKYDNLLVTRTFSKSHSLAGGRIGFGIASEGLISDLNKIRNSTNPYNINRLSVTAAIAAIEDNEYYVKNCRSIVEIRGDASRRLKELGFELTESFANFLFAKSPEISGEELYLELKKSGVLVRHFNNPVINDYNRITVGSAEQMQILLDVIVRILNDKRSIKNQKGI